VQGAELMVIKGIGKLLPLFELCILELNFKAQKPFSSNTIGLNLLLAKLINMIAMTGLIDFLRTTAFGNLIRSIKKIF